MPAQYSEPAMVAPVSGSASPLGLWSRLLRGLGSRCRVCARWQAEVLCADCRDRFARWRPRCRLCARALDEAPATVQIERLCRACRHEPPGFDAALAAVDYAEPWDRLIPLFKYAEGCELASPLAALLAGALQQSADEDRVGWPWPDWVVPVPLSAARLRERGYNQAWELARRVAPALGLHARADLVERLIDTPHQVGLALPARQHNLAGAFESTPAGRAELAGASVALVDDVLTTGATAAELARTLRRAGARAVQVWVVARTDRR